MADSPVKIVGFKTGLHYSFFFFGYFRVTIPGVTEFLSEPEPIIAGAGLDDGPLPWPLQRPHSGNLIKQKPKFSGGV